MKRLIYIIITITQVVTSLYGQNIINNDTENLNRLYIRAGIDPASILTFGYQRNMNPKFLKQTITAFAEWNVSAFKFSPENSELKIGGIFMLFQKGGFKIVNNFNISAGSLSTRHFYSKKFALADEIAFGFYKRNWFFAATTEYEKIFLNHLKHTDFYRTTYYEEAVDGWYKGAGGMFQFGIEGGITVKQKYDIHLEIKAPFTERFNGYGGSPFHMNLGLGYRL